MATEERNLYVPDLKQRDIGTGETAAFVGWLDAKHRYEKGVVDEALYSRLFDVVRRSRRLFRGKHPCVFCSPNPFANITAEKGDERLTVGSGQALIRTSDGQAYFVPDMICHYIAAHEYQPPQEFLDAIKAMEP